MNRNANPLILKGGTGAALPYPIGGDGVGINEVCNPLIYKGGTGAAWRGSRT